MGGPKAQVEDAKGKTPQLNDEDLEAKITKIVRLVEATRRADRRHLL